MAWTAANGTQSSPVTAMQISGVSNIADNAVAAGTLVRDVDDNVVYMMTNDWNATANPIGSFAISNYVKVVAKAANFDLDPNDGIGVVIATGAATTIKLPAAAQSKGRVIRIVAPASTSVAAITVDRNGANINGAGANYSINGADYETATLICDGSAWYCTVSIP